MLVIQAFFPFSALASFFKFSIEMDLESGRKVNRENAWLKSGRSDAEPRREVETEKMISCEHNIVSSNGSNPLVRFILIIFIIPTESISFSSFPGGDAGLLGLPEDGSSFSFPSGCGGAVNFVKPPIIIGTSPLAKVVSCPVTSIFVTLN